MTLPARVLVGLLSLVLLRCASLDPGPPPVDPDLLAPILVDLHLAQALAGEVPLVVRDSIQAVYYDRVLADYDLSRESFDSMLWLVRQEPQWIDTIYARAGAIVATRMVE